MTSANPSLSRYRSTARSLAAKSALPLTAGAAALLTSSAQAGIVVYVPTSGNVAEIGSAHGSFGVDFVHGTASYAGAPLGIGSISIYTSRYGTPEAVGQLYGVKAALRFDDFGGGNYTGGIAHASQDYHFGYPAVLAGGTTINASTFNFGSDSGPYLNSANYNVVPAWSNTTGYIALQLFSDASRTKTYYGWLKLQVNADASKITLLAFAYNDTPGASITTPVPEAASSAALLALGAAGLVAYRKRKNLQRASA